MIFRFLSVAILCLAAAGVAVNFFTKVEAPSKESSISAEISGPKSQRDEASVTRSSGAISRATSDGGGSDDECYRFTKNLPLADVPPHLHAKSAIQIGAASGAASIPQEGTKDFTIPLSSDQLARLTINKFIERSKEDISLMGNVAGADRSHFSIRFIDGALSSGSIKFYENGELYLIKATADDGLIVSLQDPEYTPDQCQCVSAEKL